MNKHDLLESLKVAADTASIAALKRAHDALTRKRAKAAKVKKDAAAKKVKARR